MGAESSHLATSDFEHKRHFVQWKVHDVESAFSRYLAVTRPVSRTVNLREFHEVFYDLTVVHDGAFLSLPFEVFNAFASEGGTRSSSWRKAARTLLARAAVLTRALPVFLHRFSLCW